VDGREPPVMWGCSVTMLAVWAKATWIAMGNPEGVGLPGQVMGR
jgi:hypothetical protein